MDPIKINNYWGRVIDTMNDALMIISKNGTILTTNRSFEEMTGYTRAEITGKSCMLLKCDACEKALRNDGEGWCTLFDHPGAGIRRCRCEILKKDGTYIPALKNASVLYDEQGRLLGAVETLTDISELDRLDKRVEFLSQQLDQADGYCGIIGRSSEMQKVFGVIEKAAQSDAPVIIQGESGTGKELVARAIHERGTRRNGPYIQVNCAALNEALLESELFGHVKGSFTGAFRDRKGRFETAHGGDLFLDEIGDIPLPTQIKLLRALETMKFERVGQDRSVSVDVRIITATNKNLIELISQNKFREDLYFRIHVLPILLPPLRNRKDDIPLLSETFIKRLREETRRDIKGLTKDALEALIAYQWPGNIRELKSVLHYAFTIAERGLLECCHLPPQLFEARPGKVDMPQLHQSRDKIEKEALINALKQTGGNQTQAARILNVNRVTVWNRMRKYGIDLHKQLKV